MRLTPIDRPPTLLVRIVFFVMKRMLGRVPTPYRVLFTRVPQAMFAHLQIVRLLDGKLGLEPSLQLLVSSHVAGLNGCTFCTDIGQAVAEQRHVDTTKLAALPDWRNPIFTERERAALVYVEEATRAQHRVTDETFATLRAHFRDDEIVQLGFLVAIEHYFNLLNLPLEIGTDGFCALPAVRPQPAPAGPRGAATAH